MEQYVRRCIVIPTPPRRSSGVGDSVVFYLQVRPSCPAATAPPDSGAVSMRPLAMRGKEMSRPVTQAYTLTLAITRPVM